MKFAVVLFAVFLVVAIATAEDFSKENCKEVKNDPNSCTGRKCNKDGSIMQELSCALAQCGEGKKKKVVQHMCKPYPQCCPQITCE